MDATEQYFIVVLFIVSFKVVLGCEYSLYLKYYSVTSPMKVRNWCFSFWGAECTSRTEIRIHLIFVRE